MDATELAERVDSEVECASCKKRVRYCRCDGGPVVRFEEVVRVVVGHLPSHDCAYAAAGECGLDEW